MTEEGCGTESQERFGEKQEKRRYAYLKKAHRRIGCPAQLESVCWGKVSLNGKACSACCDVVRAVRI